MKKELKTTAAETTVVTHEPEKSTEIIPAQNTIVNFNVESLMAKAIEHGLSPETMEKFLAMRQQLKAEWAKEQFNRAMAAFQSECPTIVKDKEVKNSSGKVLYRYAPIESVVNQVKSVLQKYGFSYSTSMEVLPDGVKVCVKTIHIDGHTEESCMQVPLGDKTSIMNASQQTAAAQTFAKRYAFLNAFGILTGDEDNDGANLPDTKETPYTAPKQPYKPYPAKPAEALNAYNSLADRISKANTVESLNLLGGEVQTAYQNKKINQGQYEMLVSIGKSVREKLEPSTKEYKEIADKLPFE